MTTNIYKENYELKKRLQEMLDDFDTIRSMIICIGGPLNDNILNYNNKQLVIFSKILHLTDQR